MYVEKGSLVADIQCTPRGTPVTGKAGTHAMGNVQRADLPTDYAIMARPLTKWA